MNVRRTPTEKQVNDCGAKRHPRRRRDGAKQPAPFFGDILAVGGMERSSLPRFSGTSSP